MNTARQQLPAYSADVSADQARKAEPINGAPPYSESGPAPDLEDTGREVARQITQDDVIKGPGKPTPPNSEANPASHAGAGNDDLGAMPHLD